MERHEAKGWEGFQAKIKALEEAKKEVVVLFSGSKDDNGT